MPRTPAWRRWLPPALLALAAAGARRRARAPERTVAVPVEQASVVLVTDASRLDGRDRRRADPAGRRPRRRARRFLDKVPDELRVGLVGYSTIPHTVLRPTHDRDTVRSTLDGLVADGGTATGDALAEALLGARAREPEGQAPARRRSCCSPTARRPTGATRSRSPARPRRLKIPIYTVALGTPDGVVPGGPGGFTPVPPDPETLRRIAEVSGGRAFTAEDADAVRGVYEKLGSQIGTKPEQREMTAGFAAAGFALLLLAAGTGVRFRGRI